LDSFGVGTGIVPYLWIFGFVILIGLCSHDGAEDENKKACMMTAFGVVDFVLLTLGIFLRRNNYFNDDDDGVCS